MLRAASRACSETPAIDNDEDPNATAAPASSIHVGALPWSQRNR